MNNFFIIAGSFAELPNATELMESLKSEGFPAGKPCRSEIDFNENTRSRESARSGAQGQGYDAAQGCAGYSRAAGKTCRLPGKRSGLIRDLPGGR